MANDRKRMAKSEIKPAPTVLDTVPVGVSEDEQLATTDGARVSEWVRGLRQFFTTAQQLEIQAKQTLVQAQAWTLPTSAEEDERLQRFIKGTTDARKQVEDHWSICSVIHRFHRRLTAKRDLATRALEQANSIGNQLHVRYAEAEKRRAAEEERRRREEAEFLARQEREAELARLEAEAVAAEESSPELSLRERKFVELFAALRGNGQQCAQQAGYREPLKASARLLSNAKIQMAIKALQQATTIRQQAAVRAAAPVAVEHQPVTPAITRAPGASDRTTWSGEIVNEAAALEAFRAGTHGIPADLFQINPVKLNEYARALHERLDHWPGVRAKKTTRVV